MLDSRIDYIDNGAGWQLALKRVIDRDHFNPALRPVAIVPGYAMNAHIFGFHPRGLSMEAHLARAGFEVWSLDLRAQGRARRQGGKKSYGLKERAVHDLRCAFETIVKRTASQHDKVDAIGASLGGSLLYIHAVMVPHNQLGTLITIGAPLRWDAVHPLIKAAFASPQLVGLLPIRGTRQLAKRFYPLLSRFPKLMQIYLHENIVDTSRLEEMLPTVDDPNPRLNKQIAHWIKAKDMVIDGVNITEGMSASTHPLQLILANADGIVLPETVRSAMRASGAAHKELIEVGDPELRFAHADLFVSNHSHEMVFDPMVRWLKAHTPTLSHDVDQAA